MRPPKVLRTLIILTAFGLLLGMAASASAVTMPAFGKLYVGGVEVDDFKGGADPGFYVNLGLAVNANGTFKISKADPWIGWSVDATNATSKPVNVSVLFGFFDTPGYPGPIQVHSSSTLGITDGTGPGGSSDGSVSVLPFQAANEPPNLGLIAVNYTGYFTENDEVLLFNLANSWGTDPGFSGAVVEGSGYANTYLFKGVRPGGPNDLFFEVVSFTLSANDQVALTGNCSFVPIPPTALLLGSGMLGMGLVGWRRRKQSNA